MEQSPLEAVGGIIIPGVYLCKYNVDEIFKKENKDINAYLKDYTTGDTATRAKAAEELRKAMTKRETGKLCMKVNYSDNFGDFYFNTQDSNKNTLFFVPYLSDYDAEHDKFNKIEYNYGIVLHQEDNYGGAAYMFPDSDDNFFKKNINVYHFNKSNFDFVPYSFTLFEILPTTTAQGTVTLYDHLQENEGIPSSEKKLEKSFDITNAEVRKVLSAELKTGSDSDTLAQNTRSIEIKGPIFALLFEYDEFGGKCERILGSDSNLEVHPIGQCGAGCSWILTPTTWLGITKCIPCLQSMIIIRGRKY